MLAIIHLNHNLIQLIIESKAPKGSGLGTSGILGAVVLASLFKISGQEKTKHQIVTADLYLEQLLGIGGGWQDSIGGLFGGIKFIQSGRGTINPQPEELKLSKEVIEELEERIVLYYTGRSGKTDRLGRRVHIYLSRRKQEYSGLLKAREFPVKIKGALLDANIDKVGNLLTEFTETLKNISAEAMDDYIVRLMHGNA